VRHRALAVNAGDGIGHVHRDDHNPNNHQSTTWWIMLVPLKCFVPSHLDRV
jgi:hypothetical protein